MLLAMDIGNSNIVLGVYREKELRFLSRLATDTFMEADQYAVQLLGIIQLYGLCPGDITQVVVSSVVPPLTPVIFKALAHITPATPHLFSKEDSCGVNIAINNPAELGVDILASAVTVLHTRPLPAIIIDMGTATKITAVDKDGNLLGVAISPGLTVSTEALVTRASALRGVAMDSPARAIGRTTIESMKSGVLYGTAAMLDGMIDRFKEELGEVPTLIATGGSAASVVCHCRHKIEVSDTLLLEGLRIAIEAAEG